MTLHEIASSHQNGTRNDLEVARIDDMVIASAAWQSPI